MGQSRTSDRELYQELRDAGFSEHELESKISEGHSLSDIHAEATADGFFGE